MANLSKMMQPEGTTIDLKWFLSKKEAPMVLESSETRAKFVLPASELEVPKSTKGKKKAEEPVENEDVTMKEDNEVLGREIKPLRRSCNTPRAGPKPKPTSRKGKGRATKEDEADEADEADESEKLGFQIMVLRGRRDDLRAEPKTKSESGKGKGRATQEDEDRWEAEADAGKAKEDAMQIDSDEDFEDLDLKMVLERSRGDRGGLGMGSSLGGDGDDTATTDAGSGATASGPTAVATGWPHNDTHGMPLPPIGDPKGYPKWVCGKCGKKEQTQDKFFVKPDGSQMKFSRKQCVICLVRAHKQTRDNWTFPAYPNT